jgi:tetrahydromethanopterin S-methyltransferase subunit D
MLPAAGDKLLIVSTSDAPGDANAHVADPATTLVRKYAVLADLLTHGVPILCLLSDVVGALLATTVLGLRTGLTPTYPLGSAPSLCNPMETSLHGLIFLVLYFLLFFFALFDFVSDARRDLSS